MEGGSQCLTQWITRPPANGGRLPMPQDSRRGSVVAKPARRNGKGERVQGKPKNGDFSTYM